MPKYSSLTDKQYENKLRSIFNNDPLSNEATEKIEKHRNAQIEYIQSKGVSRNEAESIYRAYETKVDSVINTRLVDFKTFIKDSVMENKKANGNDLKNLKKEYKSMIDMSDTEEKTLSTLEKQIETTKKTLNDLDTLMIEVEDKIRSIGGEDLLQNVLNDLIDY